MCKANVHVRWRSDFIEVNRANTAGFLIGEVGLFVASHLRNEFIVSWIQNCKAVTDRQQYESHLNNWPIPCGNNAKYLNDMNAQTKRRFVCDARDDSSNFIASMRGSKQSLSFAHMRNCDDNETRGLFTLTTDADVWIKLSSQWQIYAKL